MWCKCLTDWLIVFQWWFLTSVVLCGEFALVYETLILLLQRLLLCMVCTSVCVAVWCMMVSCFMMLRTPTSTPSNTPGLICDGPQQFQIPSWRSCFAGPKWLQKDRYHTSQDPNSRQIILLPGDSTLKVSSAPTPHPLQLPACSETRYCLDEQCQFHAVVGSKTTAHPNWGNARYNLMTKVQPQPGPSVDSKRWGRR